MLQERAAAAGNTPSKDDDIGYTAVKEKDVVRGGIPLGRIECPNVPAATVTALWGGEPEPTSHQHLNRNNSSVVVRVEYGESSVLITGDLEEAAITKLLERHQGTSVLDADVYVVGHHGSRNATTAELLRAVSPEVALIGVGDPGLRSPWTAFAYGHPNRTVLELLDKHTTAHRGEPIQVLAGDGAKNFADHTVTKAVYATAWDGEITCSALATGRWVVGLEAEDSSAEEDAELLVNLNTASRGDLQSLPTIGPARAAAIISWRRTHGPFRSIDELRSVPKISAATFDVIKARVRVE